jgi:hypothetical protein
MGRQGFSNNELINSIGTTIFLLPIVRVVNKEFFSTSLRCQSAGFVVEEEQAEMLWEETKTAFTIVDDNNQCHRTIVIPGKEGSRLHFG